MSRRIINQFSAIGLEGAWQHILHLEGGFAYNNRCRYCLMAGSGANNDYSSAALKESVLWYREAQRSERNMISIEEYLK